jgi:hypothetical protein
MTGTEAQNDLLGLIGVESASFAPHQVTTRILGDINATLQKLYTMAVPWWTTTTDGVFIQAPATVAGLGVTKGSKSVTTPGTGTLPAWSAGCTIRLDGDSKDNELVAIDVSAATATLAIPYAGATGTVGARVFCDAVTLPATVASVQAPVVVIGEHELVPLRSPRDVAGFAPTVGHNRGAGRMIDDTFILSELRDIDVPLGYYVERATASNSQPVLRMRFSPLPDKEYTVQFEAKAEAPRISNLANEIPVPQNYAESIFLPMLRYQFSTWKHFEASAIRGELKAQYEDAFQLLAKLKPQPSRACAVRVSGNW